MSKVLVSGYGSAGQYVVDFLLKDHRIKPEILESIHIMSRKSLDQVNPRLEISRVASGISERYIPLIYHQCDFDDILGMSDIISLVKPDIIVYTGRFASGLKYGSLSYPNRIGYGVWIPLSFPYIYNLMKCVKLSGVETKVINTSFPDGVNFLLKTVDLAPYCGAGNLNHLIPRIKSAASRLYNTNINDIGVELSCAHFVNTYVSKEGTSKGCPSLLSICHAESETYLIHDEDSDNQDPVKESIFFPLCKDNSAGGQIRNQMIATDCAEIVRYLIDKTVSGIIHIPGFDGIPGGCKCYACHGNIYYNSSWSREEVEKVGKAGLFFDGIEIEKGKVLFTDDSRTKMKEVFGIVYPESICVEEIEDFARFLKDKVYHITGKA